MELIKQNLSVLLSLLQNRKLSNNQALSVTAAATITFVTWKIYKHFKKTTVDASLLPPLVKGGIPVFGNLLQLKKDPLNFINEARDTYGPCFRLDVPGLGRLVVVTGHLIEEVMKKTKNFSFSEGVERIIPAAKVVEISYNHKYVKETISPRAKNPVTYTVKHKFKSNQIGIFSDRVEHGLNISLDKYLNLKQGQKKSVDIFPILMRTVSHISCLCFAGSRVGTDQDLVDSMAVFTQKVIKAGIFLVLFPAWLSAFLVRRLSSVEHEMDVVMKLLVPELQRIRDGDMDDQEPSFISMAVNVPKEDGSLRDVKDMAYLFNQVGLASIHTTSHFTTFALHELACRPTLAQELRDEVLGLGENRTTEAVAELPLMDSFFREVLRYDADYLGMHHLTLKDTLLSTGHVIPKDSLVVCAIQQMHTNPEFAPIDEVTGEVLVGDTPLKEFDAYRYLNKKINATEVSAGFLPFGNGAHACPGRFFASNEIKYVIAEMIMRFNFRTKSGHRAQDNILLGMTKFPPTESLILEAL